MTSTPTKPLTLTSLVGCRHTIDLHCRTSQTSPSSIPIEIPSPISSNRLTVSSPLTTPRRLRLKHLRFQVLMALAHLVVLSLVMQIRRWGMENNSVEILQSYWSSREWETWGRSHWDPK
ncbi:unnamed protein product [Lactuca saligna]|uniref:Uncharacterized protein n=1 Tax=Lactuca saligna TaxID=75948 RepID=A0AA35VIK5_LACSI|nr:unnamed protein product [Lactuca saligna]